MIIGKTNVPKNPIFDSVENIIKQGGTPEAEQCALYVRALGVMGNKLAESVSFLVQQLQQDIGKIFS